LKTDNETAENLMEEYQDADPSVLIIALGHVIKSEGAATDGA
jgi:hypothetical protein